MTLRADVTASRGDFHVTASLVAGEGETLALLGPNGAGKSTVVLALAGLIASDGVVEIAGLRIDRRPPEARPIGVAFQGGALFPHLSVLANVAFPLRARGVSKPDAQRRALDVLSRLAPGVRRDARPSTLSGGEAQRVSLARAVVHEPRLLLLDEPSSGLDVTGRIQLRPALAGVLAGFDGIRLLVTHDPVEAMTLADRVVILEDGRVTQSGTFDDVRRSPRSRYAAELVGVNLYAGRLEPIEGGAGRLVTSEGDVIVGWPADVPRRPLGDAIGTLRPSDVNVHLEEPAPGSARNVWRGRVQDVAIHGDRSRLRIATAPPIVAEVTAGSAERLRLERGADIWVSFKAVEVELTLDLDRDLGKYA